MKEQKKAKFHLLILNEIRGSDKIFATYLFSRKIKIEKLIANDLDALFNTSLDYISIRSKLNTNNDSKFNFTHLLYIT